MTAQIPLCPRRSSGQVVKNGRIQNGKQNHRCKTCGRQFVQNPQSKVISRETKKLINKLLLEKLPLAGIARVADVSEPWLQTYVNRKYETVPKQVESKPKKGDAWAFSVT